MDRGGDRRQAGDGVRGVYEGTDGVMGKRGGYGLGNHCTIVQVKVLF